MTPSRDTTGKPEARVIKFRQWVIPAKEFAYWGFYTDPDTQSHWQGPCTDLRLVAPSQQFTGLKDRTGKEIYEGDILKYSDLPPFEVVHKDGALGFFVDKGHKEFKAFATHGYLREILAETDVIGNIHQNPELLKP